MPKTIIKIRTWSCGCGYKQDCEPTQENQDLHFNSDREFRVNDLRANECPSCKLKGITRGLHKETDPEKKITHTVMGEEDLEKEIEEIKGRKQKGEHVKGDPDLSSPAKENAHRDKRKEDIRQAILKARVYEDK